MKAAVLQIVRELSAHCLPCLKEREDAFRQIFGQEVEVVSFVPPEDPTQLFTDIRRKLVECDENNLRVVAVELDTDDERLVAVIAVARSLCVLTCAVLFPCLTVRGENPGNSFALDKAALRRPGLVLNGFWILDGVAATGEHQPTTGVVGSAAFHR